MAAIRKIALWKKILAGVILGIIIGFVSPAFAATIKPLGSSSSWVSFFPSDLAGTVIVAKRLDLMDMETFNK